VKRKTGTDEIDRGFSVVQRGENKRHRANHGKQNAVHSRSAQCALGTMRVAWKLSPPRGRRCLKGGCRGLCDLISNRHPASLQRRPLSSIRTWRMNSGCNSIVVTHPQTSFTTNTISVGACLVPTSVSEVAGHDLDADQLEASTVATNPEGSSPRPRQKPAVSHVNPERNP